MKLSYIAYLALMTLPILALPLAPPPADNSHPVEQPPATAPKTPTGTNPATQPNPSNINWPDGGVILMGTLATPGDPPINAGMGKNNSTMVNHPNPTVLNAQNHNGTNPSDGTDRSIVQPSSHPGDKSIEPQTPVTPGSPPVENPAVPNNPGAPNSPPPSSEPISPNPALPPAQVPVSNPALPPAQVPVSNPATPAQPVSAPNTAPVSAPANNPAVEPHTQPQTPTEPPPQSLPPQQQPQTVYEQPRPPVRGHVAVRETDNVLAEPGDVLTEP